jgi:hypothetical protein
MKITLRIIFGIVLLPILSGLVVGQGDKGEPKVRQLAPPKGVFPPRGAGTNITILESAKDLDKLVGPKGSAQLAKQVDFAKEQILFVRWSSSGPPFGTLQFDVKAEGKTHVVEFYIQEPKAKARGESLRIRADYFAVPRGINGRFRK